jgi:hypothetical protein
VNNARARLAEHALRYSSRHRVRQDKHWRHGKLLGNGHDMLGDTPELFDDSNIQVRRHYPIQFACRASPAMRFANGGALHYCRLSVDSRGSDR